MVIAKMESPPDEAAYATRLRIFQELEPQVDQEVNAARKLINSIIADPSTPSDNVALARIETRIEDAMTDLRHQLSEESAALGELKARGTSPGLEPRWCESIRCAMSSTGGSSSIRADMLSQVFASTSTVIRDQRQAIVISVVVTILAAMLGLGFASHRQ